MNKSSQLGLQNNKSAEILKSYVPYEIQKSHIFDEIFNAYGEEFDRLGVNISDLFLQILPQTATEWGLKLWEQRIGIPTNTSKTIEDRRAGILAKLINKGTTTVEVIKKVAQNYVQDGWVEVIQNNPNYSFTIDFICNKPVNFHSVESAIEVIKPAHLAYDLSITEEKNILLETKFKEYLYPWYMCGTFLCGTKPSI